MMLCGCGGNCRPGSSNGSLLPGGWLTVTCGLTAYTPGSAPGPMLGIEYGKAFSLCIFVAMHSFVFIYHFQISNLCSNHHHHNHFTALFPGSPGWAGARRELLDFMVQGKINGGRHTDHLAGRHSIRTNQCLPPPSPHIFYRPDALPAAQPTASKHWRQLAHSD